MATVPLFPGALRVQSQVATSIRAAMPVKGVGEWYDMAVAQVWLAGRGAQLVSIGPYVDGGIPSSPFPCIAHPHQQILNWLWILSLSGTSSGAHVFGHFVGAGGTTLGGWQLDSSIENDTPQHFFFVESFATMSEQYEFAPEVHVDSTSTAAEVVGISCSELPMPSITEFGSTPTPIVEPATCANHYPIHEPASGRMSVDGLMRNGSDTGGGDGLMQEARRCMLFSWVNPDGVDTTSGAFTELFDEPPAVLTRATIAGLSVGTVRVAVYAYAYGGDETGEVRFTATSGDTVTMAISGDTEDWYTDPLDVDTEQLSRNATDGGIRDGVRDDIAVEVRTTGSTTGVVVFSVFIMERE